MNDRGAKALAERLQATALIPWEEMSDLSDLLLREHGLFIADVTKHEPFYSVMGDCMACLCGWREAGPGSYFDHIGGPT